MTEMAGNFTVITGKDEVLYNGTRSNIGEVSRLQRFQKETVIT